MLELQDFAGIAHTLQTVVLAAIVFAACAYIPKLQYKARLARFPAFEGGASGEKQRQTYLSSARQMYREGYAKFKNVGYRMPSSDGRDLIVVPEKFLPELRKLGDDYLSFFKSIETVMEVKYTKLSNEKDGHLAINTIRGDLTPALPRLNAAISAEVTAALERFLPACDDWTEVNINYLLTRMVAMVSGRVFVGKEICESDDYINMGASYTIEMMQAVLALKKIRPWLKPFLAERCPELITLRKREADAKDMLRPIVKARMEAQANDPDWSPPDDMLQWMLHRLNLKDAYSDDLNTITKQQLGLIFAAVHTTTMTATNVLYSLAVTPQYIPELREEIKQAIKEEGDFTSRALQNMVKLDSYMKEVMRFWPVGITSFSRAVLKDFTLSNGQHIPAGSIIEVPAAAINFNPDIFENPEEFDAFRFSKKRVPSTSNGNANGAAKAAQMGSSNHAGHQFVTTNESNLLFGYGRHACPGRFFAANEIKMFLSNILLQYDVQMKDGSLERHKNMEIGTSSMPDPMASLMFRKVQV